MRVGMEGEAKAADFDSTTAQIQCERGDLCCQSAIKEDGLVYKTASPPAAAVTLVLLMRFGRYQALLSCVKTPLGP